MQNQTSPPSFDELSQSVKNPLFDRFFAHFMESGKVKLSTEYSSCSMKPGWNLKLKKSGKSLCTVYPDEGFFTVLVVIGSKIAPAAEAVLPEMCQEIQTLYHNTRLFNGQRWIMIDVEDPDELYQNLLTLIQLKL